MTKAEGEFGLTVIVHLFSQREVIFFWMNPFLSF